MQSTHPSAVERNWAAGNHRECVSPSRDGAINRRGWDINKGPTTSLLPAIRALGCERKSTRVAWTNRLLFFHCFSLERLERFVAKRGTGRSILILHRYLLHTTATTIYIYISRIERLNTLYPEVFIFCTR